MKKVIVLLIAVMAMFACVNEKSTTLKVESDISKENLNGDIASVLTKSFIAVNENGEIVSAGIGGRSNYLNNNLKKYNSDGFCIEEQKYNKNGGVSKFENRHDKNGKLLERRAFRLENKIIFTLNYSYDTKGNNIETKRIDAKGETSGHWKKKFDSQNFLEEYTDMESDSTVRYIIKYNNDSLGNVLDRTRFTSKGQQLHKLVYKYDDKYRVIKEVEYYQPIFSYPSYTKEFKYNDKDLPIVEKAINNTRKYENVWTFEYKYDEHDNWIQQIQFKDDTAKFIVTRLIKYYKN